MNKIKSPKLKAYIFSSIFAILIVAFAFQNVIAQSACTSGQIVINEIYTEGGLTGAAYRSDFVELFNVSPNTCSLANFSIQVATGNANNFPNVFGFPASSVIPGGGYFLIQFGSGGSSGTLLPAPDFTASVDLSTSGKIALVASLSSLTGNCASNLTNSIDYVGYGTTNCSKGAGAAVSPTLTSSIERLTSGYNTNNNNTDFILKTPSPRNSLSPTAAGVTISGLLKSYWLSVPNARISMTNRYGEIKTVRTNQFGYFRFEEVPAGETYIFSVSSKYGTFNPVVLTVMDNISDLTFVEM